MSEDEIAKLAECFRATGADPDGDSDEHLAARAVEEVWRLRRELEEDSLVYDWLLAEARYRIGELEQLRVDLAVSLRESAIWHAQDQQTIKKVREVLR